MFLPKEKGSYELIATPLASNSGMCDATLQARSIWNRSGLELDDQVAAVYLENPNFFGIIEESAEEVASMAHAKGALSIVGVNPMSLGVLKPPGSTVQTLSWEMDNRSVFTPISEDH